MATRWGIIGTGRISVDFVNAMKALPTDEHVLTAVAARNISDAEAFASQHGVQKAFATYQDIAEHPDIDVVYIGIISSNHFSVSKMILESKKAVLCEKPLCVTLQETKELIRVARLNQIFLMEAVWSRCFPTYQELERRLHSGEVGDVKQAFCTLGVDAPIISNNAYSPLSRGTTLNLGIYPIQLVSLIMGHERPVSVAAAGHLNEEGVDETVGVTLTYSGGRIAQISTSNICELPNTGLVIGSKGITKIACPMFAPECIEFPTSEFRSNLPSTGIQFNFPNCQGLMYEAQHVRTCLKEGLLESPLLTLDETIIIAEIMQTIRQQIGVNYSE